MYLYLLLNFLPLIGSFCAGLFGRKLGPSGASVITVSCLLFGFIIPHIFSHSNYSLFSNQYTVILIFLFIAILLSVIIVLFSYILAVQKPETEKLSTYECGFEPYEDARHTFDVQFYLIAILFIVFDIETMFLIPWTSVLAQLDLVGF